MAPSPAFLQAWPRKLIRSGMGALFAWSGVMKVLSPIAFADAIRNYELIGDPYVAVAALFLPALEIVAGLCVLLGVWWRGAMAWLVVFCALFFAALLTAWARGLEVACGCFGNFGESAGTDYPLHLAGLALLGGLGGCLLWTASLPKGIPESEASK